MTDWKAKYESTLAELHDAKREELGSYLRAIRALDTTRADLARAREVIEKVRALPMYTAEEPGGVYNALDADDVRDILATYDQQT